MSKILSDSHRIFTRLVWLNIALDVLSIPIWIALPLTQTSFSGATLIVDPVLAIVDAILAAAVFALALFGIIKKKKWGTYLAVTATIAQRVTGLFIFAPNIFMAIEVIWSLLIIFFAYKELQKPESSAPDKAEQSY